MNKSDMKEIKDIVAAHHARLGARYLIFPKDIVEIGIGAGATISTEPNGEGAPVGSADPSNKP